MKFSAIEKRDLVKAWLAISIAFAIVFGGGFSLDNAFFVLVVFSGITVGLGFLLHELAHKYVAIKYGCWAEFRAYNSMLWLAILCSFFGFVFAAPGAVMIHGHYISRKQNGLISAAGPITNYVLALLFIPLALSGVCATRTEPVWQKISVSISFSSSLTISTPSISILVATMVDLSCPKRPAALPVEPEPNIPFSTTITF